MTATTLTHHAQVFYTARCINHGCDWVEEHNNPGDAADAVIDHQDKHALRHTCRYDEHAGWIGLDECRACDYEKPASLRRGRTA